MSVSYTHLDVYKRQAYGSDSFMLFSKSDKRPAAFTDFFYYKENEEFDVQYLSLIHI